MERPPIWARLAVVIFLIATMTGCRVHCLVAGTLVDTPLGPRAVESLEVGAPITTVDSHGAARNGQITALTAHDAASYREIVFDGGEVLRVTAEHPIALASPREGFLQAGKLRVGDAVRSRSGSVKIASIVDRSEHVRVFDLSASPDHTFFASGILVHNKIQIQPTAPRDLERTWIGTSGWKSFRIKLAAGGGGLAAMTEGAHVTLYAVKWGIDSAGDVTIELKPLDPQSGSAMRAHGYASFIAMLLDLEGPNVSEKLRLDDAAYLLGTQETLREAMEAHDARAP